MQKAKKRMRDGAPRRRRARTTGTIFQRTRRGVLVWVGRKIIGRKANGQPKYLERSHVKQEEMLRLLEEAAPPGSDTTVAAWCDHWLKGIRVQHTSLRMYTNSVTLYIKPTLGHLKLAQLAPRQIEAAVAAWSEALEPGSIKIVLAHLQTALAEAVRAELRPDNPAKLVRRPKVPKKPITPFTPEELQAIAAAAAARPVWRLLALLALSGCRVGEALGLEVGDWDPAAGTIAIQRTAHRNGKPPGPPKSIHSVRTIRIPAVIHPVIAAAAGTRTSGLLFLNEEGRLISYAKARLYWQRLLKQCELPFRNLHQLRHSTATLLLAQGVPLGDLAKYLGDTIATIVRTYLHATGADPCEALDRVYGGRKVGAAKGTAPKARN